VDVTPLAAVRTLDQAIRIESRLRRHEAVRRQADADHAHADGWGGDASVGAAGLPRPRRHWSAFITSDHLCVWFDPKGYKRSDEYNWRTRFQCTE